VLKSLEPAIKADRPKGKTLDKALGLLATDQPPLSDSEVRQWLDKRRMEKYG
jgi:hypothetical protein